MNNLHNNPSSTQNNQPPQNTYAKVTRTQPVTTFPKREQAIIINVMENLKLPDYIIAVGNIVTPRNIQFASRISNNRICIYLATTELVDEIVENHSSIKVGDQELTVRRLITPAKRIILSNVNPCIPHNMLERALTDIGVQPVTPISFLKATFISEEYSHIMSFRRQLYIQPDDNIQLPPSITVDYEDTSYRIFITFDDITCFLCKEKGHITKQCPKQNEQSEEDINHTQPASSNSETNPTTENANDDLIDIMDTTSSLPHPDLNTRPIKRTSTTIESTSTENLLNLQDEPQQQPEINNAITESPFVIPKSQSRRPRKIPKVDPSASDAPTTNEMMEPAKLKYLETNPTISFEILSDFLDNASGSSDPLSLAKTYTSDVTKLLDCLTVIYPHLSHRSIKSRCTRIMKKIKKQINNEDTDTDTSSVISS